MSLQELIQLAALGLRHIIDVHSDIVAKLGRDLFKRESRCLWEVKIDNRDEDDAPRDDDKVVLPAYLLDADWGGLQQDDGGGKLAEKRETHSDGADFGGEDLGHVDVHGGIAQSSEYVSSRNMICIVTSERTLGRQGRERRRTLQPRYRLCWWFHHIRRCIQQVLKS